MARGTPRTAGQHPPSQKVAGPKYDIGVVLQLAPLAAPGGARAVGAVQDRLGLSRPQAEAFVLAKLSQLHDGCYVETVEMQYSSGPVTADVYGVRDRHGGWYIKLHIEHGRVAVISCHEPEHPMFCKNGTKVR
jgi:hypothetical protein